MSGSLLRNELGFIGMKSGYVDDKKGLRGEQVGIMKGLEYSFG
jgi:hypothetical protein